MLNLLAWRRLPLALALALMLAPAACQVPDSSTALPGPTAPAPATAEGGAAGGGAVGAGPKAAPPAAPLPAPKAGQVNMQPLEKASSGGKTLLARLSPEETGINHQNYLPFERMGSYTHDGAGAASGDYDGDGLVDLYLVSEAGENKLFKNLGGWKFEDVTKQAGVDIDRSKETGRWDKRFATVASFIDYDNDGRLDLFVGAFAGANTLFRNNGDGTFTDVTKASGLEYTGATTAAAVADYDRDGDLDIFLATYRPYLGTKFYPPGIHTDPEPELEYDLVTRNGAKFFVPERDVLFRNNGNGTFTNVSKEAGIGERQDWGLAAAFSDVNNDGWPDLYVANDFETPDRFYLNNRDGTFSDVPNEKFRHSPFFSMGMDFGDINNDGWQDYMTSDMLSPNRVRRMTQTMVMMMSPDERPAAGSVTQIMRNSLHLNNQDGTFSDIAPFAGVTASDWTWTVKFADLDLDGWQDVFITNGFTINSMDSDTLAKINKMNTQQRIEFQKTLPMLQTPKIIFRNKGDLTFEDVSGTWGFVDDSVAHGATVADFDNDGDQDIVVNNLNAQAGVYRNDAQPNRLKVMLRGIASNRYGLGARITIETDKGMQVREMRVDGGYMSGQEAAVVFGLGDLGAVKKLTVAWPSGLRTELADVKANQAVTIDEPEGKIQLPPPPAPKPTQFEQVADAMGVKYTHKESAFNDFMVQPLLPHKLSQYGPGVAWGDKNGDGYDDLYIAGSNGNAGGLFMNKAGKAFEAAQAPAPPAPGLEEQAALWWPADAKALGLMTSLSSVEITGTTSGRPSARQLDGAFAPTSFAPTAASSAGPLAAADYNGDGKLDLFIGGRVSPGNWPLATDSHLYKGGPNGLEPADGDAPGLAGVGMVAGALWADVDNDKDQDLLLATEFGPVKLFRNDGGKLSDATTAAGLDKYTGWWNGLAASDVNHDGSIDFVATNLGLNTANKASEQAPMTTFGGDLDGDGNTDIIETEWDAGKLYLARLGHEVHRDVPGMLDKFTSYQSLAMTTVEDVFGDKLNRAKRFEANWLSHAVFLNDGKGNFTAKALPTEAQLTSGYGVVLADLDNDGNDDVYLVGNFYGNDEMHLGQFDGGVGVWLKGDGKGGFADVPVVDSGLSVPFDAKGLAATDYDHDGWVDLAVGVNNGRAMLFHNKGVQGRKGLMIRLQGDAGNPLAAGARIQVTRGDGLVMTREVAAGSSFLSQDGGIQVFGLGSAGGTATVKVRWPDGTEKSVAAAKPGDVVTISK